MILTLPSFRTGAALGALVCALLLGYGYWLEYFDAQEPCPLCLVQRWFYLLLLAVLLAGALHGPGREGGIGYAVAALAFALGGLATAARQVWLQHLPADKVPECGPDLDFMLQNFPLGKTLQMLLHGSGQCAEVKWTFLGMSIAEWSLAWFVLLALHALWLAWRASLR